MKNADIARKVIELVSSYQFDEIEQYIHEDIVMECPYQAFHNGPLRRGRADFMEGMRFVPNVFKTFSLNIHELYDCPDQDVDVIEQTSLGLFAAGEGTYQNRSILVFKFRDGQIHLWREFFNPEIMNHGMKFMLEGATN